MKGYKTMIFNICLVLVGLFQKIDVTLPENVSIVIYELLRAFGVYDVDGSTLIGIGIAGLFLRSRTDGPMGRFR